MLAVLAVVWLGAAVYGAHAMVGLGGHHPVALFDHWLYDAVIGVSALVCLWRARAIRADRGAWAAIGLAIVVYWLGDLYWNIFLSGLASPPYPSWSDAGWLGYYVPLDIGLILLMRGRISGAPLSTWLEGLVGALALGSVGAILVFDPVVASTHGSFSTVATNLAYPIADVLLLVIIAAQLALQRNSIGASWLLLGVGLVLFGLGDSLYLLQSAKGTYTESGWINVTWPLAMTLTATAAWAPERAMRVASSARSRRVSDAVNSGFAVLVIGVMLLESVRRVPVVAHLLVVGAVLAVLARMAISGRERVQFERSNHEARTDELTGLHNRRYLYEVAERTLAVGPAGMLLLDLNHFKEINDTLGHNSGDDLLCQVAHRLAATLPPGGELARLGGDEFVALLDSRHNEQSAMQAAVSMREALERPFAIAGFCAPMPASIGVALAPAHANTRAELLRCADVAMYRAKTRETGIELYLAERDVNTRHRLRLVSDLRAALDTDQLVLHYQPKVTLPDRRLAGVEVLSRWNHPKLGLIGPTEFVALAEQHGLMRILTLTVLDRALRQQRLWRDAGREIPIAVNLSAVNLSAVNLLDSRLPQDILALLDRHGMPPTMLQLEITEDTFMRDPERALDVLASLSEQGIAFALDDFGTGYSSLGLLKHLPVRELKIDRSFVMQMTESDDDATIVRSTIELARSLNLEVVAEGVETAEHLEALTEFHCDTAQGYHLSYPVPADELELWLAEMDEASDRALTDASGSASR